MVAKAWADIAKPSDVAKQRLALRALSAAARGTDGEKAVLQAIDSALGRASQVDAAFTPANKKKGSVLDESYELQRSAFMAARASLKGDSWLKSLLTIHKQHVYIICAEVTVDGGQVNVNTSYERGCHSQCT